VKKGFAVKKFHRLFSILFAIVAISAMSASLWADSGAISATIKFGSATKIGDTQLAAGQYKVTADENGAKFQKGNKVVAQVPCELKPLSFMPRETVYVVEHGSVSEIQVSGSEMAIDFSTVPSPGK
jgi:hypothetical protein